MREVEAYVKLEGTGEVFDYVLAINEFDPTRLLAVCEKALGHSQLFRHVVHVNLVGLLAACGEKAERSAVKVVDLIKTNWPIFLGLRLKLLAAA